MTKKGFSVVQYILVYLWAPRTIWYLENFNASVYSELCSGKIPLFGILSFFSKWSFDNVCIVSLILAQCLQCKPYQILIKNRPFGC